MAKLLKESNITVFKMKRSTRFPVVDPSPDISYRYPCAFGYMFVCEFNVCSKLYYYTRNYSVCEVDSLAGNVDPSTGTWVQDFFFFNFINKMCIYNVYEHV